MTGYFTINTNDHGLRKRLKRGEIENGLVVNPEPYVEWSTGKSIEELDEYCRLRNWELKVTTFDSEQQP